MTHLNAHTLLISAEIEWSLALYRHLGEQGFMPLSIARTGATALDLFYQVSPRLVLIDLPLIDCNAIELCIQMLRAQPETKVVLVTESSENPPLAALQAGAAGCINRNFPATDWPGLLSYIMSGGVAFSRGIVDSLLTEAPVAQKNQSLVTVGPLRIDLTQRMVLYAGQHIQLTPREFALLVCLARNPDRVVTFDRLLNEAWGYDANDGTPAQVRLYVARLRHKLIEEAQTPHFILTERGIGYRLHSAILHRASLRIERLPLSEYATPAARFVPDLHQRPESVEEKNLRSFGNAVERLFALGPESAH